MARFTYHGPVQSVSLTIGKTKDKDGKEVSKFKDIELVPGRETPDLPEDNPIIVALVERKMLRPIEPKSKPGKPGGNEGDK